jgi:hypothetical protein
VKGLALPALVPGPCEASAPFAQHMAARSDAAPAVPVLQFTAAQDMTISCEDAFRRYVDELTPVLKIAPRFSARAVREPLHRLRIHLDDAAIQSAFTSLTLRIHLRCGGTVVKEPYGADVI